MGSAFTNTFAQELLSLATDPDLNSFTSAAALFFEGQGSSIGLRVEATQIMAEFVDKVEFGRDPEGLLFYRAQSDLAKAKPKSAFYKVNINGESVKALRVDFYWKDPDAEEHRNLKPFAKFLTKDSSSIPAKLLDRLDGFKSKGNWSKFNLGVCSAVLNKDFQDSTVELTIDSLEKVVKFETVDTANLDKVTIDNVPGVLHFQNIKDLVESNKCIADFDSDRVLYFAKDDNTKLVAAFLPTSVQLPSEFNDHDDSKPEATWSN